MPNKLVRRNSIYSNYICNLAYQLISLFFSIITIPYVSRILGPTGVGINSYSQSIVSYFIALAVLGTTDYGRREVAYCQDDIYERSCIFWEIVIMRAFMSILSWLLFYLLIFKSNLRNIFLIQSVNILAVMIDITWFFQGMENFFYDVIRICLVKILNICIVFLCVRSERDLPIYIGSTIITAFIGQAGLWTLLPNYLCRIRISDINLKNKTEVLQLFFPQLAIQISAVVDKSMLGRLTGISAENGFYEQADKIEKVCLLIVSSLGIVMFSRIAHAYSQQKKKMLDIYIYRAYRFVWMTSLPMVAGLITISKHFVPWFFGCGYEKTIVLLRILSILLIIVGLSSVTGVQYMLPTKQQKCFTSSVLLGLISNIGLNLILIPKYFSIGAAVSTVLSETVVTVSQLVMVRRDISIRKVFALSKNYFIATLLMVCGLGVLKFGLSLFNIRNTWKVAVLCPIIYFVSLIIMNDEMIMSGFHKICNLPKS